MSTHPGWQTGPHDAITDVPGIRVGHWTDRRAATGCTVIRCDNATFVAADTRGGAPGTREIDVLGGANIVRRAHAIVLSGGSAFGLASAQGVMRYLSEQGIGFNTSTVPVPIVSAAVIYDLGIGKAEAFPGPEAGYAAARRAKSGRVEQGNIGAGTGATVAKLLGMEHAVKGGLGTASVAGPRGFVVGAIAATNAVGAIVDPDTGRTVAGPRAEGRGFVPLPQVLHRRTAQMDALLENTVLVCVATNAALEHHQLQRLAIQAHSGLARAVFPAHTFGDGDVTFAIATGEVRANPDDPTILGMMVVRAVERAILNSVLHSTALAGVPSASDCLATSSPR
jgi:L-aminopeptidase/D-esterase-like protein